MPDDGRDVLSAGAKRALRYRLRRARGTVLVGFEIDRQLLGAMVALGELKPDELEDRLRVSAVAHDLLGRYVMEQNRRRTGYQNS